MIETPLIILIRDLSCWEEKDGREVFRAEVMKKQEA